jgi:hypothetical protein
MEIESNEQSDNQKTTKLNNTKKLTAVKQGEIKFGKNTTTLNRPRQVFSFYILRLFLLPPADFPYSK